MTSSVPPAVSVVASRAAPVTPNADSATAQAGPIASYRQALGLFRDEKLTESIAAFSAFLARFPRHSYADNALYWRAEAKYALHEYADALADFEAVASRYPNGNKVPDALLGAGLCALRLGRRDAARALFQRVRDDYPHSVAAQMTPREDAS